MLSRAWFIASTRSAPGAYSIEATNPRHEHEWKLWEDTKLPEDKVLISRVITHHARTVEHPELMAQRIERFGNLVGRERVIAGTDSRFGAGGGHPAGAPRGDVCKARLARDRCSASLEEDVGVGATVAVGECQSP